MGEKIYVIKASGEREPFQPEKIYRTLRRAKASKELSREVVEEVKTRVYNGMTTKEVLRLVKRLLRQKEIRTYARYNLKGAIVRLGPEGFPFETYVAEILDSHGYNVELRKKLRGRCTNHEIDIVIKNGESIDIVECKFHNSHGTYTNLKEALYTYARLLDLREGGCKIKRAWLVTNTKISKQGLEYAKCRNLKVISWKYPPGGSLKDLIDKKALYPITSLPGINPKILKKFSESKMMLLKDLVERDIESIASSTSIPRETLENYIRKAEEILSG